MRGLTALTTLSASGWLFPWDQPRVIKILTALWANKGNGISHIDIVVAMGVTRATVSGLMAALERDD